MSRLIEHLDLPRLRYSIGCSFGILDLPYGLDTIMSSGISSDLIGNSSDFLSSLLDSIGTSLDLTGSLLDFIGSSFHLLFNYLMGKLGEPAHNLG